MINNNRLSLESLIKPIISNSNLSNSDTSLEIPKENANQRNDDVVKSLNKYPKSISAKYFYDDLGSQLFEQICELPEYYPTRTEAIILQKYAPEIAAITGSCELIELGSGSAIKTRILLDAYQNLKYPLRYVPIDISAGILETSAWALLNDYPSLEVHGLVGTYELALQRLHSFKVNQARLLVFLGSSLGNLNPQECDRFFEEITGALQTGDYFLLGIDLHKSKTLLEPAYNDAQGITAEFNLNMLRHLNYRFNGNFDLTKFKHQAIYNEYQHQIEMYLQSQVDQDVELRSLDLSIHFEAEEKILTEISRKFDIPTLEQDLKRKGLTPIKTWTDPQQWFGMILCQHLTNT
jgi:L-histidine Nalpha-methyltransferase